MELRNIGIKQSKLKRNVISQQGRFKKFSTIQKLAYNNAAKYEFDGEVFDYSKKQEDDFLNSSFILPEGTKTSKNKLDLFKELEKGFQKNDAFLGMNYIINLPRNKELPYEVSQQIIMDFFQEMANQKSNFIDVSFHTKNKDTDKENFHCHILEGRRAIDKQGNVGNALRLKKSELDDINYIRKEVTARLNRELERVKNSTVRYTELSNEKIVEQALNDGDVALAIEKNYKPDTKKNKGYDRFFYKKNNNQFFRAKTAKIRAEQKAKAEKYRKDLAELKELEAQQKELEENKGYFQQEKENEIFIALTAYELDEYLNNNKEKINNLRLNLAEYERDKKATRELYNNLTYEFFKSEKDFKDKRELKKFFKDYCKSKEMELTDELDYKLNLLSYKIAKEPEKYIKQEQKKEEFKQLKEKSAEIKKEVENIKEQAQIEKDALNLTREVLAEYDDNINQVFKLMNSKYFVNNNQHNSINNLIKYN